MDGSDWVILPLFIPLEWNAKKPVSTPSNLLAFEQMYLKCFEKIVSIFNLTATFDSIYLSLLHRLTYNFNIVKLA